MHLLPCPDCQTEIPVAPSQAGDDIQCPQCQRDVRIPTLGQLRQLPRAASDEEIRPSQPGREMPVGSRAGFLMLGLLAVASLLIAGFCGIRWALIEVPETTETHVESVQQQYAEATAAELVREFEDMDRHGVELAVPFQYRQIEIQKQEWGQNALMAASVGGLALLGAIGVAVMGRRKASPPSSDT